MERKVLILSLGTGGKNNESKNDYPYRTAKYRLGSDGTVITSPFVAEALIDIVEPELILIVGTVKSAWGAFYHRYHKENCDFEGKWKRIEQRIDELGKETDYEEILSFEKELNTLYAEELQINGSPKVEVCLIKYGLSEVELKMTYQSISQRLRKVLNNIDNISESDEISISFDITHSFRSVPIYNLVVIDYCRLLMAQRIKICHVFYGNLDVARENDNIAQIVDLKDIVNLMETTRGISEFHNTGNAVSFLRWFEKTQAEEDVFIRALRRFHGAMQMNARGELMDVLEELLNLRLPENADALLDAEKTIQESLLRELPEIGNPAETMIERQIKKAKFQLDLAQWCLNHGQVGLASAIAKEACRSYFVVVYEKDETKYEDEKARRRAEQLFENRKLKQSQAELFRQYRQMEPMAKKVRNTYAHNLEEEKKDRLNYGSAVEIVQTYITVIREVMKMDKDDLASVDVAISEEGGPSVENEVVIFISQEAVSNEKMKLLSVDDSVVYQLTGKYKWTNNGNRNEKIRRIAQSILLKVDELMAVKECSISKIVWGENIDKRLVRNASLLIKSYMSGSNVPFIQLVDGRKENVELDCLWNIDVKSLLSEVEREYLEDKLREYRFVKLWCD